MQPHIFGNDPPQFTCPLTYFRDNPEMEGKAFGLHMHWKQGILPAPGALDDQAAHYVTIITATEMGVNAGQNRLQAVAMKKNEPRGKGAGGKRSQSRRSR